MSITIRMRLFHITVLFSMMEILVPTSDETSSSAMQNSLKDYTAMTPQGFYRLIHDFTLEYERGTEPFTPAECFVWAEMRDRPVPQYERSCFESFLEFSEYAFSRDDGTFVCRASYFKDAEFLVYPTGEEFRDGVLIPGHRFLPFHDMATLPWECGIHDDESAPISQKPYSDTLAGILKYYSLFGPNLMNALLTKDQPSNGWLYDLEGEEDGYENTVSLTAYDLSRFYKKSGFELGDYLLMKVLDWTNAEFTLTRISAKDLGTDSKVKRTQQWKTLEEAFQSVFTHYGRNITMPEQIAQAYWNAGEILRHSPTFHLGGFVNLSKKLRIWDTEDDGLIWYKNRHPDSDPRTLGETGGSRPMCFLDEMFYSLGISLDIDEVEAIMRDELFSRSEDLERVKERCFGGRSVHFNEEEEAIEFYQAFEDLWEETRENYNFFTDQERGKIRRAAIEIIEDNLAFLRKLDAAGAQEGDVPVDLMQTAAHHARSVTELLSTLNSDEPYPVVAPERVIDNLLQIGASLTALESQITNATMRNIAARTSAAGAEKKKRNKRGPSHCPVYTLRIDIDRIKPPIWRRIRVPGWVNLGDLHVIIQNSFGWDDSHLHNFEFNGTYYCDPETQDGFGFGFGPAELDETKALLEDLGLEEKDKLTYTYDFGDDWKHTIRIEKIESRNEFEDPDSIVCLKGKRACPPEDCVGPWGYEEFVDAISDPENPNHEQQMAEWYAEEFDPEYFDITEVNEILKEIVDRSTY